MDGVKELRKAQAPLEVASGNANTLLRLGESRSDT